MVVRAWLWTTSHHRSLLLPAPQTRGHGLIQRWSQGPLLLFPCLWWPHFPMVAPSPTLPTLSFHAMSFSCPAEPPWTLGEGIRQEVPWHQQLMGHQQRQHGYVWGSCHSCNLISGIIVPSLHLQITSLSPTSIFSWETLNRKFRKMLNAKKAPCSYFYIWCAAFPALPD